MEADQIEQIFGLRWILALYACIYAGSKIHISKKYLECAFIAFSALVAISLFRFEKYDGIRLQGFYHNPNVFSLAMVIPWAFMVGFASTQIKKSLSGTAFLISISVLSIALFLSYTRGVWIAAAGCLLILTLFKKHRIYLYLFFAGVFSAALMFTFNLFQFQNRIKYSFDLTKGSSQSLRITGWKVGWQIFLDHPWFGTGFYETLRLFPTYYQKMGIRDQIVLIHTHNQFLQVLDDSGLVGFSAFIIFFSFILKYFFQSYKAHMTPATQSISLGTFLAISVFLLSSISESPLMVNEPRAFLILIGGTSYGYLCTQLKKNTLKSDPLTYQRDSIS